MDFRGKLDWMRFVLWPRKRSAPSGSATQRVGTESETLACQFLTRQGLRVLTRNARYRDGELDIVAQDVDTLVFVEVRRRRSADFGGALASVNRAKRARLAQAARRYLYAHTQGGRLALPPCRFDVIAADDQGLCTWIRGAFELEE